jgi:hypothetical protein
MAGRIFHPESKHPQPYQQDLNPDASKGMNYGLEGAPVPTQSAYEIKDLHEQLADFGGEELRQIRVVCEGARLETGATYLNLADDPPHEIQASGDEDVRPGDWFVPKKEVAYELWNRLLGRKNPSRTKRKPK